MRLPLIATGTSKKHSSQRKRCSRPFLPTIKGVSVSSSTILEAAIPSEAEKVLLSRWRSSHKIWTSNLAISKGLSTKSKVTSREKFLWSWKEVGNRVAQCKDKKANKKVLVIRKNSRAKKSQCFRRLARVSSLEISQKFKTRSHSPNSQTFSPKSRVSYPLGSVSNTPPTFNIFQIKRKLSSLTSWMFRKTGKLLLIRAETRIACTRLIGMLTRAMTTEASRRTDPLLSTTKLCSSDSAKQDPFVMSHRLMVK